MPHYALSRHVFVCIQGEHVVFLDVRKDRYFALEAARTAGLGEWVAGWPVPAPVPSGIARRVGEIPIQHGTQDIDRESLGAIMSLLVEKEIVTSRDDGKTAAPEPIEPPTGELCTDAFDEHPGVRVGRVVRFVSAAVRARLLLKHRTFESVVTRVRRRVGQTQSGDPVPESYMQELVSTFAFLRPYFFAAKDACLFDALALSEYLATYRVYPRWIFGVQARPFAAHCWLQLNGIVLNDTLDHVRRYAPIMVV
jgi:hypothetical protein